ncbi:MAG: alanyl-tRNA editing protein [Treponema sp.]|jgi:alanyl-tRNA synthetase|nr:alanyl-tRNA editing protein [Treponema sp.]
MQTQRAYYDIDITRESYCAEIREIRVLQDTVAVMLDKTIFYPEGGGQSGDRGTINGVALVDVQEKEGEILHLVSALDGARLELGPAVLVLDMRRRRDFTVLHTAQHLLSGTILRLTGTPTVSMHLGDELCTIDVDTKVFPEETCIMVEEAVADAIEGDQPVIIHHCPPEKVSAFPLRKVPPQGEAVIRVVEIQGHDFSPCCGTHLASTGQIGMLRILGAEKYKGMTRITFIAGRRVLRDSRLLRHNGELSSRGLKVPVAETGKGVLALLEKTNQLERTIKVLEEENAGFRAEALLRQAVPHRGEPALLVESIPDAGIDEVIRIGRAAQKLSDALIVLVSPRDVKFAAFCSVKGVDIRPLLKGNMEAQGGHGGGGASFFQGTFPSGAALAAFVDALP